MKAALPTERAWLRGHYDAEELTPEASARRYQRSRHPDTRGWLRVSSPEPPPRSLTEFLIAHEVRVPRVGPAIDGVYLVEDLGDVHLVHQPTPGHYAAVLALHRRYFVAELPTGHPNRALTLDAALFRRELDLFAEAFLWRYVDPHADATQHAAVTKSLHRLAEWAADGPQALQHRDLHSRNVLIVDGSVALIDHQDMRRGPLFYDLASLATDAYVDLDEDVRGLLAAEQARLGDMAGMDAKACTRQARRTALQRVLKALGTFGRLLGEGRGDYRPAAERAARHAQLLLADCAAHDAEAASLPEALAPWTPRFAPSAWETR